MKNISLFLVSIAFLLPLKGFSNFVDDSINTKHEFSVSYDMSSANHINVFYARRISEKNWLKVGVNVNGSYASNEPIISSSYPTSSLFVGTTLLIGVDRHKTLKSNFEFISGLNVRLNAGFVFAKDENPTLPSSMRNTTTSDFSYGLGATFGIYYKVSENFSIGSSINPLLLYNTNSNAEYNVTSVKMYLTDMSVICLRYKL